TSSPHAIVGPEELEVVMRERDARPLLLIDIAVPRDIDPACAELEGVSLYDIDDLQAVVARNLNTRAEEIPRAEAIVEEEIRRFARWLGQLDALPTVSALRDHGSALALAQARSVAALLPEAQLVPIVTSGDRGLRGGDKSRWVAELERALLSNEVDLAVHSAKDVPAELAEGLQLAGAPPRADPED